MLNNEYLKILKDPKFSDINVNFLEFWSWTHQHVHRFIHQISIQSQIYDDHIIRQTNI